MRSNYRQNLLDASRQPSNPTDIASTLMGYDLQPVVNDGEHNYMDNKIQPKSNNPSFTPDQDCEVYLTDSGMDVTEFNNSFIRFDIEQKLTFNATTIAEIRAAFPRLYKNTNTTVATDADSDAHEKDFEDMLTKHQYIFIGYKLSSEAISGYGIACCGQLLTTSTQNDSVTEQYLYGVYKSKDEISNKKYVYSPYNEVAAFDNSICGTWVPLRDILQGECTITIPMVVPYNTILALQSFEQFPTFLFGCMTLFFKCSPNGEVWTQVNPIESLSKSITQGVIDATKYPELTSVLACAKETWGYTRAFQQVGLLNNVCFCTGTGLVETTATDGTTTSTFGGPLQFYAGTLGPTSVSFKMTRVNTFTKGYMVQNTVREQMRQYFLSNEFGGEDHVYTVCAQRIDTTPINGNIGSSSFNIGDNINFNRTTDLYVLMPLSDAQKTVFFNPCEQNLQLTIGNINYPKTEINTTSPEFVQLMLMASDFDALFAANDSYEHSLTDARVGVNPDSTSENNKYMYVQPYTDDTDCVLAFQLQREGASRTSFDGIHGTLSVRFKGSPAFPNCNLYSSNNQDLNAMGRAPPAPTLCMCQDTYWIFRLVKGNDGRDQVSAQYVRAASYSEAKQSRKTEGVTVDLKLSV